jgi:hypothetical protein
MKRTVNIVSIFILLFTVVACEDRPEVYEFPTDEYFYEIPEVPVTEDYVVGVSYDVRYRDTLRNVWWDTGKGAHQLYTGTPELGEYDMRYDPETLRQHLEWGKEAGIDFFILSWGGRGYNDTILVDWENLYRQDMNYPKVVIRFDPGYRFRGRDTLMLRPLVMDTLRREFDSIYTHIMTKEFAYKNKNTGDPVMVLTNFTNQGHITSAYGFTKFLRESTVVNGKLWIMAELQGQLTSPERWGFHAKNGYEGAIADGWLQPDSIKAFDAFFITDISTGNKDRYDGLYSFTDYNYRYWQERMIPLGKEYVPTIMPAFDNLINDPVSNTYLIPRWNSEKNSAYAVSAEPMGIQYNFTDVKKNPYQELANVAKRNIGPSRILIIYNWNNFTNGITLEPTKEYGKDYLRYTKAFFKKP